MRSRTRTNMWDRIIRGTAVSFPSSYTSYTYLGTKYYAPWDGLLAAVEASTAKTTLSATTYAENETIVDEGGPQRFLQDSPVWNNVTHTALSYHVADVGWKGVRGTTQTVRSQWYNPPTGPPALPSVSAAVKLQAYTECYNELLPKLQEDLSLANFIYELKDLKSLMKHFAHGKEAISAIATDVKRLVGAGKSGFTKKPVKRNRESYKEYTDRVSKWRTQQALVGASVASDIDLSYHYAVKPLIRDVAEMSILFGRMREKINAFNAQGSVRNVAHAVRFLAPTASITGTGDQRIVTLSKTTYRQTAEMTYRLKQMSDIAAMMHYSGLRLTPATIWNAIPFTFVIDHFTNMGEVVASFDNSEVMFDMTRLMESYKSETAKVLCFVKSYYSKCTVHGSLAGGPTALFKASSYGQDTSLIPVSACRRLSYERSLTGVPYIRPPVLPKLQIPTMDQIRLDLDLVYQIFGRGNNKPAYRRG